MTELVLFSLDVLVKVPHLYTNALRKTFEKKVEEIDILELLAEKRLNVYNVIHFLCEKTDSVYEVKTRQFNASVHEGVFRCVKDDAFTNIYAKEGLKGIFYPLDEPALQRVIKGTKLPIDVISGYRDKRDIGSLIKRACERSDADKLTLIAGETIIVPEGIEDTINAKVDYFRSSQGSLDALSD